MPWWSNVKANPSPSLVVLQQCVYILIGVVIEVPTLDTIIETTEYAKGTFSKSLLILIHTSSGGWWCRSSGVLLHVIFRLLHLIGIHFFTLPFLNNGGWERAFRRRCWVRQLLDFETCHDRSVNTTRTTWPILLLHNYDARHGTLTTDFSTESKSLSIALCQQWTRAASVLIGQTSLLHSSAKSAFLDLFFGLGMAWWRWCWWGGLALDIATTHVNVHDCHNLKTSFEHNRWSLWADHYRSLIYSRQNDNF